MTEGSYHKFRLWQEQGLGQTIYQKEKEKIVSIVKSTQPQVVVQLEGRALLDHFSEEMMYYHVSEEPNIETSGYTIEAEQGFMPFPDQSIDLLLVAHALELYQDQEAVIAECSRILSPGGRVVLMMLSRHWLEGGIPKQYHPLGDLSIMPLSTRKIISRFEHEALVVDKEYTLLEHDSIWSEGLSDMIIQPMGFELVREEVVWNDALGVLNE